LVERHTGLLPSITDSDKILLSALAFRAMLRCCLGRPHHSDRCRHAPRL